MNIVNFLPCVADIVLRARYIACVSAEDIELNFGSDADSVPFPVFGAAPTRISLLEPSVYMCFYPFFYSRRLL